MVAVEVLHQIDNLEGQGLNYNVDLVIGPQVLDRFLQGSRAMLVESNGWHSWSRSLDQCRTRPSALTMAKPLGQRPQEREP